MAAAPREWGREAAPAKTDFIHLLARFREAGILVFLVLLMVLVSLRNPNFLTAGNMRSIMLDIPMLLVVSMGMTAIIISRNIDLSVGSTLGLSAMTAGLLFKNNPNLPMLAGALAAIATGTLLGTFNGLLVTKLRVPAIIATLGTLSVYRGLIFIICGGRQVEGSDLPPGLISLSQTSPLSIPWIVLLALAVVGAMHFFLRYTRTGRCFYAIGGNAQAAQLRGVPVDRTVFLSFAITGALAGLAGIMSASRLGFVQPASIGAGFELSVIAATIIGGTNVAGGSGSVPGTVLGCILLGVIQNALVISGLSAFWQLAIYGAIILVAVTTDSLIRRGLGRAEGAH